MNDVVVGINEIDLGNLSIEVLDYADRVSEILDKIDTCIEKLPEYYQGSSCTELMNLYHDLTPFYSIIKNNIISYADDFIELINKMNENDKYFVTLFQEYTDETKNKTKLIEN